MCDPGYSSEALKEAIGDYDYTKFVVHTPQGGPHYHYGIMPGQTIHPSVSKISPHVDVRSFNSYCLFPPSRTADGNYTWDVDPSDMPELRPPYRSDEFAKVPSSARKRHEDYDTWVIEPDLSGNVVLAINWLEEEAQIAIEGQGGDLMAYTTAAHLKSFGISPELAFDLLWEHRNPRCEPPWGPDEVDHLRQKVANAYVYNTSPPGNLTPAYKTAKLATLFSPVASDTDERDTSNLFGRFQFADRNAISEIRSPQWLIKDFIPKNAFVLMFSAPGSYKTFVALDIAL